MNPQGKPDFRDPDTVRDPYPAYAFLRTHHPVYWSSQHKAWMLTRFDDVFKAQSDATRYSSDRIRQLVNAQLPPEKRAMYEPFIEKASRWMYAQDGKVHEASRHLLGRAFTPRSIEALRADIQAVTDELLATMGPSAELMSRLFNQVPARVLAMLYGIPKKDALKLRRWTDVILMFLVGNLDPANTPGAAAQGLEEMYAYFGNLIERRRQAPRDDLVSRVIAAAGPDTSTDDLLAQVAFVLVAGYTTSADMLGIGLWYLLTNPAQLNALLADGSLMKPAIEEMLRIDPSGQFSHRVVTQDIELRGQTLRKGDLVYLIRAAANRDPEHFADPDRFNIQRAKNDHLAFGRGVHFCLGPALFRLEAEVVFSSLLKRFPNLRLLEKKPPVWRTSNLQFRGLKTLHVELEPIPKGASIQRCFSAAPWEKNGGYCRALRVGETIVTSGTVAFDEQGNPYASDDVYLQTRRCLEIIEAALKRLGTDRTRVIATRMYTTNVKWWPQIAQAHKEFFEGCEPTTMLLGVKALITPDYLVEIEAQAQAPEARP
ncbi:cytochrome P450 [Pseudomonas veronii]|uniref:cytochrome P450 n=1 Tax=Pseudomonas veronii TaxID=76761 RepID=UPI001E381FF5|nr:cytochrome P450 [Pseudomonas veronii]UHH33107.1 cytochrome P450 [Pseudomonas veronii]